MLRSIGKQSGEIRGVSPEEDSTGADAVALAFRHACGK